MDYSPLMVKSTVKVLEKKERRLEGILVAVLDPIFLQRRHAASERACAPMCGFGN
jgi:hypothetical protein